MRKLLLILALSLAGLVNVNAQCPSGFSELIVLIQPDNYPNETSWTLRDINGTLIGSGGSVGDTLCVADSTCLIFEIKDSYGDGICCGFGFGSYSVTLNGVLQATGGQFTYNELTYMGCPQGSHCSDSFTALEDSVFTCTGPSTWYEFIPDSTGTYTVSTCFPSNTCDTRIWIYDRCTNLVWNSTNIGTIFYNNNDSACAPNASIEAGLQAGQTYYIRIGGDSTCTGQSIAWNLVYAGPMSGCMDPAACNYNPLAIIPGGTCIYPGDPLCTNGPDLIVDQVELQTTLSMGTVNGNDACLIGEGCLTGYGQRQVVNFSTRIANIGDADYYIGQPQTGNQFVFDQCHGHWHYAGYARYDLYDSLGVPLQAGFKNGFCVMDLQCFGGQAKYGCSNMGISASCADIYGAGLACQWIDITNVPAGRYTLVVRVNWDESPDKNGRVEQRFDNNVASVCIDITRNAQNVPSYTLLTNCPPLVDCMGDTFGLATYDCMGVCNGPRLSGDIDVDSDRDGADVLQYMQEIVSQQPSMSCKDVNGDGLLTVTDADLVNACVRFTSGVHAHPGGTQNTHRHCEFPYNIININDTVVLGLAQINTTAQWLDVTLRNRNGNLMGVDFGLTGVQIDSVVSLITGFQPVIRWDATGGRIALLDTSGASLVKNTNPVAFLRVYYQNLTSNTICLSNTSFVAVNGNDEETITQIQNGCVTVTGINIQYQSDYIDVFPNPTPGQFRITTGMLNGMEAQVSICDAMGRELIRVNTVFGPEGMLADLSAYPAGIYLVRVHTAQLDVTNRIVRW